MDRIDLSAETWIEDMYGWRYLVTENLTISIDWPERYVEGACTNPSDSDWFEMGLDEDWGASVIWRIPLTDAAPAYEYRQGEPWTCPFMTAIYCGFGDPGYGRTDLLHRRAAAVCDGAEQFRVLHAALKEARDHDNTVEL